jgi:hypothetical protein
MDGVGDEGEGCARGANLIIFSVLLSCHFLGELIPRDLRTARCCGRISPVVDNGEAESGFLCLSLVRVTYPFGMHGISRDVNK